MDRLICGLRLVVFTTSIYGCTTAPLVHQKSSTDTTSPATQAEAVVEAAGDVAHRLQGRYDDHRKDCGNMQSPAYFCSGLLIRSTKYSDSYFSWRPNPTTAPWGVNLSWLRSDSNFADSFPTANGFIVYPTTDAQRRGFTALNIRCVYPRDAWSTGPDRCLWHQKLMGQRLQTPLCQQHVPPVLTAKEWIAAGYGNDENQCAFGTAADNTGRAEAWWQMIEVRRIEGVHQRNELVALSWVGDDDRQLPIEAFFYRADKSGAENTDSLASARNDQKEFMKLTGRWVPIVRWDATDTPQGGATFSLRSADQLIAAPAH